MNLPHLDGAIVGGMGEKVFRQVQKRCKQVVNCSGNADPKESFVVCLDDYAAGVMAAEHLLDCRLQNFAFYGLSHGQAMTEHRYQGFKTTIEAKGYSCIEVGLGWPTNADHSGGAHWPQLVKLLKDAQKPLGVMALDDTAAEDLAAACLAAGISVPDQVAIVGVNNDDLLCDSSWPPLSSIEADYSRAGYVAASMIERALAGEKIKAEDRAIRLPPLGVVRRQSTDILAVDDPSLAEAVRFIREHACDPCNVGDVLRKVPVGRRWLERQFVSKLGRSPHDEILRVRIEVAKRLLKQPELTIPDIAARVGASAVQNFCRTFEQAEGVTPAAYRRTVVRTI
ncbi:MAG: substrate-binding domain-containing protein [Burkholderiales bacterium]|nr:substrate-binding domain-containing protein [Phycisphaerae bacterium]